MINSMNVRVRQSKIVDRSQTPIEDYEAQRHWRDERQARSFKRNTARRWKRQNKKLAVEAQEPEKKKQAQQILTIAYDSEIFVAP